MIAGIGASGCNRGTGITHTRSYDGDYTIDKFTCTVGTVSGFRKFRIPVNATEIDVLIVGAGGPGTSNRAGGGAGGFRYLEDVILSGILNIKVGKGGTTTNGDDSFINSLIALGGGKGGSAGGAGSTGGSGGGGGSGSSAGNGGAGTVGQGNDGGNGYCGNPSNTTYWAGGAGAGAGEDGTAGYFSGSSRGGTGGDGLPCSITGTEVTYAGGGGAGADGNAGAGGLGGGGNGGGYPGYDGNGSQGTDGLGAGGGGSREAYTPGRGGAGVVIVRYKEN